MRLIKITERIVNDFWGDMECEFCGHTEKLTSGYYDNNYFQNVIPAMQCVSCGKTGNQWKEKRHEEILNELKEIAHYFGGWNHLRKEIEQLEDADNEAAWERHINRY